MLSSANIKRRCVPTITSSRAPQSRHVESTRCRVSVCFPTDEMSMRQWSLGGTHKNTSSHGRPSTGEWKIGVGDLRGLAHDTSRQEKQTADVEDVDDSQATEASLHWFDVFRNRYQVWTRKCRDLLKELLSFGHAETGTHLPTKPSLSSSKLSPEVPEAAKSPTRRRVQSARTGSPSPSRFLCPGAKVIYFIRHGTAYCNTCRVAQWIEDQRLTPRGWSQVTALRRHMQSLPPPDVCPPVLVSSPPS